MANILVKIPSSYLVILATHGTMGDGKVPKLMQVWAEKECIKHGLQDEVRAEQERFLLETRERLKNKLGDELMKEVDKGIEEGKRMINQYRKEK